MTLEPLLGRRGCGRIFRRRTRGSPNRRGTTAPSRRHARPAGGFRRREEPRVVPEEAPPSTRRCVSLHPKPLCVPTPENFHPEVCFPAPETRNSRLEFRIPKSGTRNPKPETRNPDSEGRNPDSETRNPNSKTMYPETSTLNPQPPTLNPQSSTLDPGPKPAPLNPQPYSSATPHRRSEHRNFSTRYVGVVVWSVWFRV